MNIGVIGLGKLGLPVAVSIAFKGHKVIGHDLDSKRMSKEPQSYQEAGPHGTGDFNDWLDKADNLSFGTMEEVAAHSEIIFVAVQTPHDPMYEGIIPLPNARVDFDYAYLRAVIRGLSAVVRKKTVISIISTCLPGTIRREIFPLLNEHMQLVYNPFFIAMGTTMHDFLHTEFVLLGVDNEEAANIVQCFYAGTTHQPIHTMSIESAELTKVVYNTFISLKIVFANTIMEICDSKALPGADCDAVLGALQQAKERLISPLYLKGGMGDGGGCHPRDNIAMSWLARELDLSFDLFEAVMRSREEQAYWKAEMLVNLARDNDLPIIILGYAFKPGTNLTVGSPASLVAYYIREMREPVSLIDKYVTGDTFELSQAVYLIGCLHPEYKDLEFPKGSIVVDPHRIISDQEGVTVLRLGEGRV